VRARRILLLLTAWLSFDLATPLPGAFEFEIKDSEIEHSLQAGRESHAKRAAASSRTIPRDRVELDRPSRRRRRPTRRPLKAGSGRSGSRIDRRAVAPRPPKTTSSVIPSVS
jgi:hypothetical protein